MGACRSLPSVAPSPGSGKIKQVMLTIREDSEIISENAVSSSSTTMSNEKSEQQQRGKRRRRKRFNEGKIDLSDCEIDSSTDDEEDEEETVGVLENFDENRSETFDVEVSSYMMMMMEGEEEEDNDDDVTWGSIGMSELNRRKAWEMFERSDYDDAMHLFQNAYNSIKWQKRHHHHHHHHRKDEVEKRNLTISSRLCLDLNEENDWIEPDMDRELYVYQRDVYNEGFGTFATKLVTFFTDISGEESGCCWSISAVLLHNMGLIRLKQKRFGESLRLLFRCLLEIEDDYDDDDESDDNEDYKRLRSEFVTGTLHNIGYVQYLIGNYKNALLTFEEAYHWETGSRFTLGLANNIFDNPRIDQENDDEVKEEEKKYDTHYTEQEQQQPSAAAANHSPNVLAVASIKTCLFNLHWCLLDLNYDMPESQVRSRREKLRNLASEALETRLRVLDDPKNHVDVAVNFSQVAASCSEKEIEKEISCYEDSLKILRSNLPVTKVSTNSDDEDDDVFVEHPDVLGVMINLAYTHYNKGDLDLALDLFQQCERGLLEHFGPNHRDVALVMRFIADVHGRRGNFDKALDVCQESLNVAKRAFGDSCFDEGDGGDDDDDVVVHSQIGFTLHLRGLLRSANGDNKGALKDLNESLCMCRSIFGHWNYRIAPILYAIGDVDRELERYESALVFYQDAIKIWTGCIDVDQSDLACAHYKVGLIHESSGENTKAYESYQTSLLFFQQIRQQTNQQQQQSQHKETDEERICNAHVLHSMGALIIKNGSISKGLEYLNASLSMKRSYYQHEPSADTSATLWLLAQTFHFRGDEESALSLYRQTLHEEQSTFGPNHVDVASTIFVIAKMMLENGELDIALSYFNRTKQIELHTLGPKHASLAQTWNWIGILYMRRKDLSKMMHAFSESARIYRMMGSNDWSQRVLVNDDDFFWYDLNVLHPNSASAA